MEATIVLGVFLTFLFGGMMLALVMGYRSIEADRARQDAVLQAEAGRMAEAIIGPGFFDSIGHGQAPIPTIVFDDALVAQLEKHVRAEQAMVTQFVRYPSVDSLYSKLGSSLHVH